MPVTIRRAELSDRDAIAGCLAALGYSASPTLVSGKLASLETSSADTAFVAVDPAAGIVGVVSVHVLPLFHAPGNLGRVTALVVLKSHRVRGIGRALMAAAETFAWEHECQRVEVTSGDHREDAHAFYARLGYQVDERRFLKHRAAAV